MNMSTIVLGLLAGLVASILSRVVMAAKIVSIGWDTLTIKKALRKTTTTGACVGSTNATAAKMPARKQDAEVCPAA
jgi:cyanophycinase-like exopeptidase